MACGLVSTAHSPEDPGEHGHTTQFQSPQRGSLGSTAGGGGEQSLVPEEQHRQKVPGEPQDVMCCPSYRVGTAAAAAVGDAGFGHLWSWLQRHPEGKASGRGSVNIAKGEGSLLAKPGTL